MALVQLSYELMMRCLQFVYLIKVPSAATYPVPPGGGRFCEENFLGYLDLYCVNPAFAN